MNDNTIKSNKWGRRIHSPFVYRLVTEIIFSAYPYYSFDEIKKIALSSSENEELKILFRILNFFQPQLIKTVGEWDENVKKVCNFAIPDAPVKDVICVKKSQEKEVVSLEAHTFIIWNNYCCNVDFSFENKEPIVFVFRKIKDLQMRQLFENFQENKEVAVTIELRYFGIAIVNGKFQKQNYVINH